MGFIGPQSRPNGRASAYIGIYIYVYAHTAMSVGTLKYIAPPTPANLAEASGRVKPQAKG